MTQSELYNFIKTQIELALKIHDRRLVITTESDLRQDIELDEIDLITITSAIEHKFCILIYDEEIEVIDTVSDLLKFTEHKIEQKYS